MCGIVGCVGRVTAREEKLFNQLLIVDSLRGEDSTGVAAIEKDGTVKINKRVGDPYQLLDSFLYAQMFKTRNVCLIGHNRAATTGKVVRKNAHPFENDGLVGVHNGTLRNKHILTNSHKFDTDSEALYDDIANKGLEDTISKVQGAYALVWYDKNEHTVNFLRNNERPMNFIFSEDKKTLFFASEVWMLTAILGRDGYKHTKPEILPEDAHFSYQIPELDKEFEKAKVRAVKQSFFQVTTKTKVTGTHSTGGKSGKKGYPKANVFIESFRAKANNKNTYMLGVGSKLTARAVYWTSLSGEFKVSFNSLEHPGADLVMVVKDNLTCRNMMDKKFDCTISRVEYKDGKWVYWIDETTMKQVQELAVVVDISKVVKTKADHRGIFMDEEEFKKRYGQCTWCATNVTFEENFYPISEHEVLCATCRDTPDVQQYLPGLRNEAAICC